MTPMRGVGHLRATALGLALLLWPCNPTSAGDVAGTPGEITASLRTIERPADLDPRDFVSRGEWNDSDAQRRPNAFLDGHLLPRVTRHVRRMKHSQVQDERRYERFNHDMSRATEKALTKPAVR